MTHEEILSGERLEIFMAAYRASSCDATIAQKLTAQGWTVSGKTIHDYRRHLKLPLARRQAEASIPDAPNENSTIPNEKPTATIAMESPLWAQESVVTDYELPDSPTPYADKWERLEGDYALISDLHIPFFDKSLIERFFRTAEKLRITRFVVLGDVMDAGQFSKHSKMDSWSANRFQDDILVAEGVFNAFTNVFESGLVFMGNHDEWWLKTYRNQVDPNFILPRVFRTPARIAWSGYEQAEVSSGSKDIRLLHGANYSQANPVGVAKKLCSKFLASVVMGHQHHAESGLDLSGRFQAVCLGCAADPRKMMYLHKSPRTNPTQTQGYAMLKDGFVKAFSGNGGTW